MQNENYWFPKIASGVCKWNDCSLDMNGVNKSPQCYHVFNWIHIFFSIFWRNTCIIHRYVALFFVRSYHLYVYVFHVALFVISNSIFFFIPWFICQRINDRMCGYGVLFSRRKFFEYKFFIHAEHSKCWAKLHVHCELHICAISTTLQNWLEFCIYFEHDSFLVFIDRLNLSDSNGALFNAILFEWRFNSIHGQFRMKKFIIYFFYHWKSN